ncbi:MAG TPA: hypothetical protein VM095_00720 [Pyrinomonadaceae bacterium]|nr:hypothetical protein [Pyrinomonadaceae bacterium]
MIDIPLTYRHVSYGYLDLDDRWYDAPIMVFDGSNVEFQGVVTYTLDGLAVAAAYI